MTLKRRLSIAVLTLSVAAFALVAYNLTTSKPAQAAPGPKWCIVHVRGGGPGSHLLTNANFYLHQNDRIKWANAGSNFTAKIMPPWQWPAGSPPIKLIGGQSGTWVVPNAQFAAVPGYVDSLHTWTVWVERWTMC